MGKAFRCDECEDYFDGRPAEKVYTNHGESQRSKPLRAELCEDCSENFAGGPPEADDA